MTFSSPSGRSLALALLLALSVPAEPSRAADAPRVVEVTARRFQFTPAEVRIRRGETVILRLRSADVTHGFFQRALGIDATIEPGAPTEVTVAPREAGRYTVICDHFCGAGHGNMAMEIVVE
jgi:cytochrome c oxidase subunit II